MPPMVSGQYAQGTLRRSRSSGDLGTDQALEHAEVVDNDGLENAQESDDYCGLGTEPDLYHPLPSPVVDTPDDDTRFSEEMTLALALSAAYADAKQKADNEANVLVVVDASQDSQADPPMTTMDSQLESQDGESEPKRQRTSD